MNNLYTIDRLFVIIIFLLMYKALKFYIFAISKTYPMAIGRTLSFLFLFSCIGLNAQQLSLFTQYRENLSIINPAAPESDFFAYGQNLTLGASYRAQWVDIANAPRTAAIRGSYIHKDGSGVSLLAGGYLVNDQTGPTGFTGVYGRIGGIISGDPQSSGLSVALTGGMVQYRVDGGEIRFRQSGDLVGTQNNAQFFPDVGLGVFYYLTMGKSYNNIFYGGVSVPQVIGLDLTFQNDEGEFSTKRIPHFYGVLGFYKFFDNESFLEPSVWVKYANNVPINVDVNLRYQLPTNLWVGAGYATSNSVHLEAGVLLGDVYGYSNTVKIGYGFDYSFSTFGPYTGTTHEINLAFSLDR